MLNTIIDPIRLAKQGVHLNGEISLKQFSRLRAICEQKDQPVRVDLAFGVDKTLIMYVRGHITLTVDLICQRCNEAMTQKINTVFSLSPVLSEAVAKQLPIRYEPLMVIDGVISVYDMIEDEILLTLPMVSKHGEGECRHTQP